MEVKDFLLFIGTVCVIQAIGGAIVSEPKQQRLQPRQKQQQLCVYENKTYVAGSRFKPDACTSCHCPHHGGRMRCTVQDCLDRPNCVRFAAKKDECCQKCLEFGCMHHDGKVYRAGTVVSSSHCEHCFCPEDGGRTICVTEPCKPVKCVDFVTPPGSCCPVCPNGPNCLLGNEIIKDDAVVRRGCRLCQCPFGREPFWATRSKSRHKRTAICENIC